MPGKLKPLEGLKVNDVRSELDAPGISTTGKLKNELQADLVDILRGAQRVPTLLSLSLSQSLADLNLQHYKVLDCEFCVV